MNILSYFQGTRRKADDDNKLKETADSIAQKYALDDDEARLVLFSLKGISNKKIALEQKLTISTVEHRFHAIYRKCGISGRAGLHGLLK